MKLNLLTNLRSAFVLISMVTALSAFAQPANDKWTGAITITPAANEAACNPIAGTTIGTLDASLLTGTDKGPTVCSASFYKDDVWYKFTTPATIPNYGYDLKGFLDEPTDIAGIGFAVYESVATTAAPLACVVEALDDKYNVCAKFLKPNTEYYIRLWSANANDPTKWDSGNGTFRFCLYDSDGPDFPNSCLWGCQPGQGDFDGGLSGWTATTECPNPEATWVWSDDVFATQGAFSTGGGKILSETVCNGAMTFDSDFYDNAGTGTAGTGICPAVDQVAYLTSPTIDLSGFPDVQGVNVVFSQALRQYQSMYFVEFSIDNGQNWTSIEINTEAEDPVNYVINGPHVNNQRRIFLPGIQGQSQVKIRFKIVGNYYYWIIDDVYLTEREPYNTRVNPFYAIAPNKQWQKDQLDCFGGLADVANIGSQPATNVTLTLDISKDGNTIFTDVLNYNTIAPDSVIENLPMPNEFCHPNKDLVTYEGKYTVASDSTDFDISDNERRFDWTVTDVVMAKEALTTMGGGVAAASDNNFTWGNIYHIVNSKNDNNKQLAVNTVAVGISNAPDLAAASASIFIYLYKWVNSNDDDVVDETERTTVGFAQYEFVAGDAANQLFTVPMFDFTTFNAGVNLEDNTDYILAVQFQTPDPDLQCFICSDDQLDYGATDLRTTLPGFGPKRFSHVLDVGNTNTMNASTFTGGNVPVIRMNVEEMIIIGTTEPKLDDANTIVVAPNPVANDLNVIINLVAEAKNAKINITDITGKTVLVKELNGIKSTTESFNVSNLSNGSYYLNFATEAGVRTVKFIVSK